MTQPTNKITQFWNELKRRKVVRVIIVYAAAAFVILELVDIVSPSLGLPSWTLNLVIVLLAIGFPLAIIFSWIFDITPRGIKKTEPVELAKEQKEDYPQTDKISRFENSIAVLPFQDMSPQKDQEYFCDGMTEEIINALTHVESLKVIARTSSFAFKDKHEDIREIGKKLDVETLLEGSIRKADNRLRITAQLIKVADGSHLWSERYDRNIKDVFAIQDEISLAIVDNLKVKILGKEKIAIVKRYTEDLEAYNLYLKGRYYWNKRTKENLKKSIEYFEQAIERGPDYAIAFAGLADVYNMLGFYSTLSPIEAFPKAKATAMKALEIDEGLAEAHASIALAKLYYDWDWSGAKKEFMHSFKLNPGYATAHHWYAEYLALTGCLDEAVEEAKTALKLGPFTLIINTIFGFALYYARQYDQAIKQLLKTLKLELNFVPAMFWLGLAYERNLLFEEAITTFQKAISISKEDTLMLEGLGTAYAVSGNTGEALKVLDELMQVSKYLYISPYYIAAIYKGLGDKDQVFKWLEKAYKEHDHWLIYLKIDPIWDNLHLDPRFQDLLKLIVYPEN